MAALATRVSRDLEADVTTVHAAGLLDLASAAQMRSTLLKVIAECPVAVIVDVSECTADHPAALTVFPTVARHQGWQPPVTVLITGATPDFLSNGGRTALGPVPTHDTIQSARSAVATSRTEQRRVFYRSRSHMGAAAQARDMVSAACRSWGLEALGGDAQLVVSELVANAIAHGSPMSDTPADLRVEAVLRGALLHLRVHDSSPLPPVLGPPLDDPAMRDNGRGLRLVEMHSTAWGYAPTGDGDGKVVWATLRARPIGHQLTHGRGPST